MDGSLTIRVQTMSCRLVRRMTCAEGLSAARRARHRTVRKGVMAAWALLTLIVPQGAVAQDAVMSTTVVPLASGAAASRINFDTPAPRPATDRSLALPSLSLTD